VSTSEGRPRGDPALEDAPEFDLECLFDDAEHPTEVTVFSPDPDRTPTEWLTAERASTISIDEIR